MKHNITSGAQEREQSNSGRCRYCRDSIYPDALICKTCGEPQVLWRRAIRLVSTLLSSVVALGSLGIAVLQYNDAKAAQKEANVAKASEVAQVKASEDAVRHVIGKLD